MNTNGNTIQDNPKICKGTIMGKDEDDTQVVWFEFEYLEERSFFSRSFFHVNFVKLLTPIIIKASDLVTDIENAIAEALGESPEIVRIECEIENEFENTPMFI